MKVALAGATGLVGNLVLKQLLENQESQLITLNRRNIQSHERLENQVIDWSTWTPIGLPADIFICCLGTTIKSAGSKAAFREVDFEYVRRFAQCAKASNASKLIFISANGANSNSSIFYNRVKGEAEEMLKSFNFPSLAILRPSLLIGHRKESRFAEAIAQRVAPHLDFLLWGSFEKYQSISAEKVAQACSDLCKIEWSGNLILESDKIKSGNLL